MHENEVVMALQKNITCKKKCAWRIAATSLLLLLLSLSAVYISRVALINEALKSVLPDYDLHLSIGRLNTDVFRRSLSIHDLSLNYKNEYAISIRKIAINGLNHTKEDAIVLDLLTLQGLVVFQLNGAEKTLILQSEQVDLRNITYTLEGNFNLEQLLLNEVTAPLNDMQRTLRWQQLQVDGIKGGIDFADINVSKLKLDNVIFEQSLQAEKPTPIIQLNALSISKIKLSQLSQLQLNKVIVLGGEVNLLRDTKGNLNLLPSTEQVASVSSETEIKDQSLKDIENTEPFQFDIKSLSFSAPLKIAINDQSVKPAVNLNMVMKTLQVNTLHNRTKGKPTSLTFSGKLGDYALFEGNAKALMETSSETFEINFKLTDFELPLVTGYSQMSTGYEITSGQLDFDLKLKVNEGELGGTTTLELHHLLMAPVNKKKMSQVNKQLSMPLPTALYVMEDGDKRIALHIPMKGDMNNPSFSWNSIYKILTTRALKEASYHYVKTALFPGGLMVSAAFFMGSYTYNKLTELPPLQFEIAKTTILPEHLSLLDNLSELFKDKPKLTMKICSYGIAADAENEKAILSLAHLRAESIRQHLVDKGLASARLFKCLEHIDQKAKKPYVKLVM